MKRLLFLLPFVPFLVNAQSVVQDPGEGVDIQRSQKPVEDVLVGDPSTNNQSSSNAQATDNSNQEKPAFQKKLDNESIFVEFYNMGITIFDLQTNNSLGRRIYAHDDSSVSAVWTQGEDEPNFSNDRGTGYNHFNGTEILRDPEGVSRLEDTRTGWPNIGTFGSGNNAYEFTLTHIAGDPDEGSGGYAISENQGIGSSNFSTTLVEAGSGPIWWRTATSGDWLHKIGNYTSSTEGPTPVVDGITRPLVYYRSNDRGQTWIDSNVLLPGYADSSKRGFGTADIYSIDAQDSVVAIVLAENVLQLTMWKSTDYGETWDMHEIESSGLDYDRYRGGLWNIDTVDQQVEVGDDTFSADHVTTVVDDDGTVHVSYNIVKAFRDGRAEDSGSFFYQPYVHGIKYWNDEHTENQVLDRVDTNYKDTTVYNFRVEGETKDSFYVSYDTAYKYSYDTVNKMKDSMALDSPRAVIYGNFNDSSMQPLMPTDTAWKAYYAYEFDTSGNRIDSTYHVSDTLYLDSNKVQVISGYDSVYRSEKNHTFQSRLIGTAPTIDTVSDLAYTGGSNERYPYGTPIASRPTIAKGGGDTLYVVYEAMVAGTGSSGAGIFDYRDLYLTYSLDGGQSWEDPINVTNTAGNNGESAYPSLHREMVDGKLHLVWQEDEYPDEYASASDRSIQSFPTDNFINYAAIDKSLIFDPNTGIESAEESKFQANAYPNPFKNKVNVTFELEQSSEVSYQLYNMTGQVKQKAALGNKSKGRHEVNLNTNGLSNGVYFLKIHSSQGTKSLKVVKQ